MKSNRKQLNAAGEGQAVRKGFALRLVALIVLFLAVWLRPGIVPRTSEQKAAASVPGFSRSHLAVHGSDSDHGLMEWKISSSPADTPQWNELRAAQALADPIERDAALNRLVEGMTAEAAANLLARLKPEELKGVAARRLFDHWATASPGEAAAWALGLANPEARQPFLNLAAARWATTDLSQATTWARGLPDGDSRAEIMAAVGSEAVRSAPLEALRVGVEMPPGMAREELIRRAVAEWAVTDQDGAMEWARQIEDEDLRQRTTAQVLLASADQDPVKAANLALQDLTEGVNQDRAVLTIIQHWVQTDPEAASAWVSQFPEGNLRRDAAENLVNLWANQDLIASGNWLLTLPPGTLRDGGVISYSRVLERTNPESARRWLSSISISSSGDD